MATSGSVFSETLQEITNTKLDELSKRRSAFEEGKASLLVSIQAESDAIHRLAALADGVKKCFAISLDNEGKVMLNHSKHTSLEIELRNIDRFINQARCDPSVSSKMIASWEGSLLRQLDIQSLKFEYASLYGQLVTEWLEADKKDEATPKDITQGSEVSEPAGGEAKSESRSVWEEMVFEKSNVDEVALKQYLDRMFASKDENKKGILAALRQLRDAVSTFEGQMLSPYQFNASTLRWVIRSLHSSDLLSDEKREVLKDFEGNAIILNEIADVLNMRIGALASWTWSSGSPVLVEMRRKISGIYNIHMHEDLLQAIFLQYIGIKWSVFFKKAFRDFRKAEGAWESTRRDIPKKDRRKLGYYLGPLSRGPCLQTVRSKKHKMYFMAQLMNHEQQSTETAEGDEEAEYEQFSTRSRKRKVAVAQQPPMQAPRRQLASKAARKSAPSTRGVHMDEDDDSEADYDEEEGDDAHTPMALKQQLLHLLSTEITINTRLYGEITAFHSVFESWNPLLPHETVLTVLKYFGVSKDWLQFFQKFLQAPLKFIEDKETAPTRLRRRGTPGSHVLSDVFGETVLFCLDFAVNQSTSGCPLWRIHDDVWFWSREHSVAVEASKTLQKFAHVTGTRVNPSKAGTVRISNNSDVTLAIDEALPDGEIRWGFLRLSSQTGRFEIDQTMVDAHIQELHQQLQGNRKSIFAFIQTWNSYAATFFTSNFGKAANCFGRDHVDNMLATHERIQRQIFSSVPGQGDEKASSVAEYLKKELGRRFGIDNVPEGYLYFPMELGGLDLKSPFVSLLQIRDRVNKSPFALLDDFEEQELIAYKRAEKAFLDGEISEERYALDDPDWEPESEEARENFMTFEDYVQYREEFCFTTQAHGSRLHEVFNELMARPVEESVDQDVKVTVAQSDLGGQINLKSITGGWHQMEPYWRWITMMYGPEIIDRFGGLKIVDPGLLPMGMVVFFRDSRVKW